MHAPRFRGFLCLRQASKPAAHGVHGNEMKVVSGQNFNDNEAIWVHMGGCQNYGPLLDPYFHTAPNI